MNHSTKQKNYNMKASHRKLLMLGMVKSFTKNGYLTTTLAKGKALKSILQSEKVAEKIFMVRMPNRHGDNASMVRLVSSQYVDKKFTSKTKKEVK